MVRENTILVMKKNLISEGHKFHQYQKTNNHLSS